MILALKILAGLAAYIGLVLFIGRFIRVGHGPEHPAIERAEADYQAACLSNDTRRKNATLRVYVAAKNAQLAREIGFKVQR